jgi:large subunit ribosomal protein L19
MNTKFNLKNIISIVEEKYLTKKSLTTENNERIQVGDIIRVDYTIFEGDKERVQHYEGLIISISNKGLGKSFILRRIVEGIGVEQLFVANSPRIISIIKKQSSKIRRSKLYFIRFLNGKSARLKIKN